MLVDTRRRSATRLVWTLVLGFFLGGIFTQLSEMFLPESAARTFLTTSVQASVGPFSMDLLALSFTLSDPQPASTVTSKIVARHPTSDMVTRSVLPRSPVTPWCRGPRGFARPAGGS